MTGCLYTSFPLEPGNPEAGVIPMILADTMATKRNVPDGATHVLPSTIGAATAGRPSVTRLVRKLHITGNCAMAFAGDGEAICQVLDDMNENPDVLVSAEHPMDALKVAARQWRIEYIGVHVPGDMSKPIHSTTSFGRVDFGHMERCTAIGTGIDDLIALCKNADDNFTSSWDSVLATPIDKIIGLGNYINATRLAREMVVGPAKGWGGYVEWAYFNPARRSWERGPPTLNLFYEPVVGPDNQAGVRQLGRAVAYDPGPETGRVLVCVPREEGGGTECFRLEPVRPPSDQEGAYDDAGFWNGWRPESVTVTLVIRTEGDPLLPMRSLMADELKYLNFQIDEDKVIVGLNAAFLQTFFKEMLTGMGLIRNRADITR